MLIQIARLRLPYPQGRQIGEYEPRAEMLSLGSIGCVALGASDSLTAWVSHWQLTSRVLC